MRTKLYYLSRSYYPYQKAGGPLMRRGAVQYLQEFGWDIHVVIPNYNSEQLVIKENVIQLPFKRKFLHKLELILERMGFYEDYLDKWIENAFEYLKGKIRNNTLIFATTGGELAMIKLGSLLKKEIDCKFIVNFRDPIDYTLVNGLKLDKKFHVSRERQEKKYLSNVDLIITSSKTNQQSLLKKYPHLKLKIYNNYFGYIKKIDISKYQRKIGKRLKIAYVGNMSKTQKPEILYDIYRSIHKKNDVELYFIGDFNGYKPIKKIKDPGVKLVDFMPHEKFLKFMIENIDIGFVSLSNDYLGACVPSKIYEYINLGLPILGALPDGDGKDIINDNGYGIACKYNDLKALVNAFEKMTNRKYLNEMRNKILADRDQWHMKERIKEVDTLLRNLINENRNF